MPNILIIGCGAAIHPVHAPLWNEVTVDIAPAANPTHVGDVRDANFIRLLKATYPGYFDRILFENIPGAVFSGDAHQLLIMNALDRLLAPHGTVRIRTGADGEDEVRRIRATFVRWGYTPMYQAARRLAAMTNLLDLAVDPADLDEPFVFDFQKVAGARRGPATV